jgi:glycosyltransferase involved in cell wall biosynthesis
MIDYVVPTWNSAQTLALTLESIRRYGNPKDIIIVDRHSKDGTIKIAESYGCKIISSDASLGAARRIGAQVATTPLIGSIDSDVELTSDWPKIFGSISNHHDLLSCGAISAYWGDKPDYSTFGPDNGNLGCALVARRLLLNCTDMDHCSAGEDCIFSRWLASKKLLWFVAPIKVLHHAVPTPARMRWHGAGRRTIEGFKLSILKRVIGGAILGIPQEPNTDYWQNWIIRLNYLLGYLDHDRYKVFSRD